MTASAVLFFGLVIWRRPQLRAPNKLESVLSREAGFVVNLGLEIIKSLKADRQIRRVLIVGPGLDLAPRTGFRDTPPESYQPWAVIDAGGDLLAMYERHREQLAKPSVVVAPAPPGSPSAETGG